MLSLRPNIALHIQCLRKVFRPLNFFHILLRYRLILKLIKSFFSPSIYTQYPIMTKQKQDFRNVGKFFKTQKINVLVPSHSSNSCGEPGACTLTRSPGVSSGTLVRRFLRHIGTAGFWVKQAVCQEAVRLGRVVLQRTHGS